jgi:hypothetical protein
MSTLIDFMTRTKGIEYLLAVVLLVSFYIFWKFLIPKGKPAGLASRLTIAALFIVVVGALAFFVITSPPAESPAVADTGTQLLSADVLADMYGPVWLNHDLHKELIGDCTICHHFSGDAIKQCRECHSAAFNPKDINKPGLTHVYHLRCIGCHTEMGSGPTQCEQCHSKATVPPMKASHPLTQIQNCLSCHGPDGLAGVKKIPASHSGVPGSVCQLCHKPPLDSDMSAVPRIPHDKNQPACLECHGEGIAGAKKVPASHAGRTTETCLLCHRAEGE